MSAEPSANKTLPEGIKGCFTTVKDLGDNSYGFWTVKPSDWEGDLILEALAAEEKGRLHGPDAAYVLNTSHRNNFLDNGELYATKNYLVGVSAGKVVAAGVIKDVIDWDPNNPVFAAAGLWFGDAFVLDLLEPGTPEFENILGASYDTQMGDDEGSYGVICDFWG